MCATLYFAGNGGSDRQVKSGTWTVHAKALACESLDTLEAINALSMKVPLEDDVAARGCIVLYPDDIVHIASTSGPNVWVRLDGEPRSYWTHKRALQP